MECFIKVWYNTFNNGVYMETVKEILLSNKEKSTLKLNKVIIKTKYPFIGVKTSVIKTIAKTLINNYGNEYLNQEHYYYEEYLIHGMMIGYLKSSFNEFVNNLNNYIPYIDNWALCDQPVATFKTINKHYEEMFPILVTYVKSDSEYKARVGYCCFLSYYINKNRNEYFNEILKLCDENTLDYYYVKMMIAWLLSVMYIKNEHLIINYLKNNNLDDFTFNKTISKINDSFRVTKEQKIYLKQIKLQRKEKNNESN